MLSAEKLAPSEAGIAYMNVLMHREEEAERLFAENLAIDAPINLDGGIPRKRTLMGSPCVSALCQ